MQWVLIRRPRQGASNEYPQHMFSCRSKKNVFSGFPSYLAMSVEPALVAQLDAHLTSDQEVLGSTHWIQQHSFLKIDFEIFSMVMISLLLI